VILPIAIEQTDPNRWRVTLPTTAPLDVYLYGVLISDANTDGFVVVDHAGEPPLEIVPHGEEPVSAHASPRVYVQWRGRVGAELYRVQRYQGGAWRNVARFTEDGRGYYVWRSGLLADGSAATFRVVAETAGAQQAGDVESWAVIRHPAAPAVAVRVEVDEEDAATYVIEAAPKPTGITL